MRLKKHNAGLRRPTRARNAAFTSGLALIHVFFGVSVVVDRLSHMLRSRTSLHSSPLLPRGRTGPESAPISNKVSAEIARSRARASLPRIIRRGRNCGAELTSSGAKGDDSCLRISLLLVCMRGGEGAGGTSAFLPHRPRPRCSRATLESERKFCRFQRRNDVWRSASRYRSAGDWPRDDTRRNRSWGSATLALVGMSLSHKSRTVSSGAAVRSSR